MLVGRDAELLHLERLLAGVRTGASAVLVLRGEPGVGKSALLEGAAEAASGMRVLRARGVESEVELPFSGLHELLRPLLGALDELPAPQAEALRTALALGEGPPVGPLHRGAPPRSPSSPRAPRRAAAWSSSTTPTGSTAPPPRRWPSPRGAWWPTRSA